QLLAGTQKLLDRTQNRLAVRDSARHYVVLLFQELRDVLVELAAAVGAFDLAVPEQIQLGQQRLLQELDAVRAVVAPVVAVGEMEGVDVPLRSRVALVDDLVGEFVGDTDFSAAGFS